MEMVQETSRVMVGLDVGKAWLDVHVAGSKRQFRVTNDATGVAELVRRLGGGSAIRVVMEASGGYERVPHRELVAQGVVTAIVNPKATVADFYEGSRGGRMTYRGSLKPLFQSVSGRAAVVASRTAAPWGRGEVLGAE